MMKDSDVSKDNMSDDRLIMDFIQKKKSRWRKNSYEASYYPRYGRLAKKIKIRY